MGNFIFNHNIYTYNIIYLILIERCHNSANVNWHKNCFKTLVVISSNIYTKQLKEGKYK